MLKIIIIGLVIFLPLLLIAEVIPPIIGPDSPLPPVNDAYPCLPIFTDDPIGETFEVGMTWYDYQHNGSTDRQIVLDSFGDAHVVWMNGLQSGATDRHIFYNHVWQDSVMFTGGIQISQQRSGYTTLDIDDEDIIYPFFHSTFDSTQSVSMRISYPTMVSTTIPMPSPPRGMTWPHGVVDNQGFIHVAMQTNPNTDIYYSRSEDSGFSFMIPIDITSTAGMAAVSQSMAASTVSNKVALGFTNPIAATYTQEDVFYFESLDGTTWNFNSPVNITNFGQPGHPMTNDVRAWTTVNMLYDYNDNLHIVYSSVPYPTLTDASIIWHWSQATGHTKIVGELEFDAVFVNNDPGVWHSCWDLPCLGIDDAGVLYCTWEQCTNPGDESAGSYGNWDVWATYSMDNGETWMAPVNLTDTQTPGAPAGQCLSEGWPTLARKVDSHLHILYIQDRDAGGIPQNEGNWTENPVIYQKVPVEAIMTDLEITIPTGLPIVIPANGGSFDFDLQVYNLSDNEVICDGYTEVELPNGSLYGPIVDRPHLVLPGGASIFRSMSQNIPASAPAGNYQYIAGLGDYGWNVWAMDSFPFEKLAVNDGGEIVKGWDCFGWDSEEEIFNTAENTPESFASISISPNPFNPETEICFTLSRTEHVRLSIFDISGREVSVLVNNMENQGTHKIKFNSGNLSSGVYFFSLTTSGSREVVKTILLK